MGTTEMRTNSGLLQLDVCSGHIMIPNWEQTEMCVETGVPLFAQTKNLDMWPRGSVIAIVPNEDVWESGLWDTA